MDDDEFFGGEGEVVSDDDFFDGQGAATEGPPEPIHVGTREQFEEATANGAMPHGRQHVLPETTMVAGQPDRITAPGRTDYGWSPQTDYTPTDDGQGGVAWQPEERGDAGQRISAGAYEVEIPSWLRVAAQRVGDVLADGPVGNLASPLGAGMQMVGRFYQDTPEVFRGDAALAGASQAATLGFADEIGGALSSLAGGDYEKSRDRIRDLSGDAIASQPNTAVAAALPAAAAVAPLLPSATALGAGVPGVGGAVLRTGLSAAEGVGYGALGGYGGSENDGREALRDASRGALAGGITAGVVTGGGEAITGAARHAGGAASGHADALRLRALGAQERDMKLAEQRFPGGISGAANAARRQGLVGSATTPDQLAERIPQVEERALRGIQEALGLGDNAPVMSADDISRQIGARSPQGITPGEHAAQRNVRQAIRNWREGREGMGFAPTEMAPAGVSTRAGGARQRRSGSPYRQQTGEVSLRDLQDLKNKLRTGANHNQLSDSATAEAYREAYREVSRMMDDAVEQRGRALGDPQALQRYREARQAYQIAQRAEEWSANAAIRGAANRQVSPTDHVMGAVGAAASGGNPIVGLASAGMNRLYRAREHSIWATGYEAIARLARTRPDALGTYAGPLGRAAQRGPGAFAATYYTLFRRDPEFRDQMRQMSGQQDEGQQLEAAGSANEVTPDMEQDYGRTY